eukprot:s257_g22.t1
MTTLYGSRGPGEVGAGWLAPSFAVMKFCHPILAESEFICESGARENAMHLTLELTLQGDLKSEQAFIGTPSFTSFSATRTRSSLHVGFASDLEFYVGAEEELSMTKVCLPESSFACGRTPWSGCPRIAAMHIRQHHRVRDLQGNLIHQELDTQLMAASSFASSPRCSEPFSSRHLVPRHADADPLSSQAVCISSIAPIQSRRTDDWINPRPSDFPHEDNEAEDPDPDVIPDPVNAPAFVHDLFRAADHQRAFTNPDDEGLLRIRSWYLHHSSHRRMTLSRTLEFYEDWRHWEPDILNSWRDFVTANEETEITLVVPDPFRGYLRQIFHADLIISQGTWLPSLPGLVTIHYRGRQSAPHSWAVAASFNMRVSGFEIATAAGVLHWCQSPDHQCWISFAGTAIPLDPTLRHRMRAGHSFVVTIEPAPVDATGSSSSRPPPSTAPCLATADGDLCGYQQPTSPDYEDQPDLHDDGPPSPDPPPDDDASPSSLHSTDKGVLVYGLHVPERHCFVTWTTYMAILDGIVHGLHLRKATVRCFHHLSVSPVGLHSAGERAVILQQTDDIAPGSPEKRILVDTEVHFHPLPSGLVVPTAATRRVMKVNPHLHREQMLLLLDLSDYCQLQRQRCLLHKNNQLWDHRDRTVHEISHGDYVRVQVPPPDDHSLDTEVAIGIAREFGTTNLADCPTFMPSLRLFQSSVVLQHQPLQKPRQLRSDLEADYTAPPSELDRPLTTLPRSTPTSSGTFMSGHLHRLRRLLNDADLVECEEEGPVGYITTWYIHHVHAPDCRVPRPVRLTLPSEDWLDQLLELWHDLIDPTATTSVCLVKPQPPCEDLECTQAHLILVQGLVPDRIALLISVLTGDDQGFGRRQITHSAHSAPPVQNAPSILRLTGYDFACAYHHCLVRWRSLPFAPIDWEVVDPGANIEVHFTHLRRDRAPDIHSLLQLPTASSSGFRPQSHGFDLPEHRAEQCAFQFNRHAAPFTPGLPSIFEQDDFTQEVYHARAQAINTWEDEDPAVPFAVWFVDHHRAVPHCDHFRIAHLQSDFTLWMHTLETLWLDQRHPGVALDFHFVQPAAPLPRGDLVGHILLVQRPHGQWVTSLVSIYDNRNPAALPRQIAVTTHEHILLENILRVFGLYDACVPVYAPFHCTAWYGILPIVYGRALPGRSGYSIVGHFAPRPRQPLAPDDSQSFLQLFTSYVQNNFKGSRGEERLTGETVAHARRPSPPQRTTKAIKLIAADVSTGPLPSYIEIDVDGGDIAIRQELRTWGHCCDVCYFSDSDIALCFSTASPSTALATFYIAISSDTVHGPYCSAGVDPSATALHHMQFLHSCGHPKAVIQDSRVVHSQGLVILFEEPQGGVADPEHKYKPCPVWPAAMPQGTHAPLFDASALSESTSPCLLRLGVDTADLQNFFNMSTDLLYTSFEDLGLPDDLHSFMTQLPLLGSQIPDRYIIYVDGSSQGPQQHRPPEWIEEFGTPDAWAMLVLAECYATPHEPSRVFLVGWTSQQVRYTEDSASFLGSQHVGSLTAEREGMIWAMLWRVGCNNRVPTFIRSDSQITCKQTKGLMGASILTEPFLVLRGLGQLLDTALPPGHYVKLPAAFICVQIKLSLCTANVLSMYFSPEGHAGKLSYLVEQFCAHGLVLGGLQETRTPMGTSRSGDVLRFCSGAVKGQGGVELWVNLRQPFGWQDSQPLHFRAEHFQVLLSDPHRLAVRAKTSAFDLMLFVGHAPHSGRPDSDCKEWWTDTVTFLQDHCGSSPLLVMIDANAAPGDPDNVSVFKTGLPTSRNTCYLRGLLDGLQLGLPQTLPLHQGGLDTWISPDGAYGHCIDYIAIPQHWLSFCTWSQLLEHFDLGNSQHDHSALAIELQWTASCSLPSPRPKSSGPRIDRSLISQLDPESILCQHGASWTMDVEQQVDCLNQQLLRELHQACPARRGGPKKSFISAELWQHRRDKLHSRFQLKEARRLLWREALALTFQAWRGTLTPESHTAAFEYKTTVLCGTLRQLANFHHHAKALKHGLQQARRNVVASTLQELPQAASASTILHALRPLIGSSNLKSKGTAPLPIVQKADGSLCQSPAEALSRWVDFFGQMEGGTRLTPETQRQHWLSNLKELRVSSLDLDVSQLPTLAHLEASYRHVANNKATGPDQIPSEVCHNCPAALARHTFALLLKGLCHGQEALLHKGGRLVPLWKGKLSQQLCEAYRSILISSHIAKSLHRVLRLHQASIYELYLQRQQIGGQRKAPVTYGVHAARAYHRAQKSRKRPSAFIFLDLREAFYRVLRPLALSGDVSDLALAQLAARLQLSDNILHDLRRHLQEPGATERANMPPHLRRTLRALHLDTHWHIGDQVDACSTTIGTRPGDAFADIVFGYLWSRVLQTFQDAVEDLGAFDSFPADSDICIFGRSVTTDNPEVTFIGPCWMDDLCIALSSTTCSDLIRKVQSVASELLDQCIAHAMSPNLAAGKTEVLFSFHGSGSRQAKRDIYGPTASPTLHLVGEYHPHEVRVVTQYMHLGCVLHHSGDQRAEINRRLGIAHKTFTQHRRHLFRNPAIPWLRRIELFHCLVLSKFLYGTESWTIGDLRTKEHLHSALLRLFRRLLGTKGTEHLSDDYILYATGLPSPTELLRVQRLRYLGTLENCYTLVDWGVLNSDPLWLTYITEDLRWLSFQLQDATHLPDPALNVEAWLTLTRHHPGYWKRLIKRACLHACRQRSRETRIVLFHQRALQFLHERGFTPPDAPPVHRLAPDQHFGCMHCQLRCQSKGGEGAHMNRKHQQVNPVRFLFQTTQCMHCMKEFHTATKLKAHLLHSTACRTALVGSRCRFSPLPGSGSQADGILASRHNRLLPPLPVLGPCPQDHPRRDFDFVHWDLHDLCCEALLDLTEGTAWEDTLRTHIANTVVSWTCCRLTLRQLVSTLRDQPDDDAVQHWGLDFLVSVVEELCRPEAWTFLVAPCPHLPGASGDLNILEAQCTALNMESFRAVPKSFGRHRIILHAFSGRRRVGDFQLNGIDCGWILAMLAGPPCETWSRARAVAVDNSDRPAPRVLRTAAALWGLPHLRLRELAQIDVGNLLLIFTAEAFLRLAFAGGCAVVEHPREPDEPELASIWRLPFFQLLCSLHGVELLSLNQGLLGAASAKPTNLMTLNLPGLGRTIVQHQVTKVLPRGSSIGKTQQGHWATGALKEYPPAMSRALACQGLEDEVFFSTKAPQVDPGNLLAQAPVADWPEAEGEDHLRMRVAPWLSGSLFLILLGYSFWKARCAKDDGDFDRWVQGPGFLTIVKLQTASSWDISFGRQLLGRCCSSGPELFIFDSNRPATCFKAYLAWMFSLPQLPDPSTWPWWLPGRLQCPWGSDIVTLVRLSDDPGLGLPCNELVAKCSIKAWADPRDLICPDEAAAESGVILYTTTAVVVAGHAANWAELVLPFLAASYALHAVSQGICFEIASAELSRTATHKGVQGVGAASVQAPANDNCPKCSSRYMSDSKYCRRCGKMLQEDLKDGRPSLSVGTSRRSVVEWQKSSFRKEQVSQDGKYCASLIQFQDYSARQVLKKWRLKTMGTVLAVAVGLSLWCLGGQLLTGFMVGVLLATTWELLHPAKLEDLKGYARKRLFECLLWPIYGSFAPLHLADWGHRPLNVQRWVKNTCEASCPSQDPTRDHNEEEAGLDSLMLPAWCGLRTLFIVILWTWTLLNSQNFPKFPAFWSLDNLVDPRQYQLLIAWCWVIAGACAAMAFPAVSVRVHRRSSLFSGKGETNFSQWVQLHGKEWQLRHSIYTKNQILVKELQSSDPDVVYDTTGPFADLDMAEFTGKLMPKRCCLGSFFATYFFHTTDAGCPLLLDCIRKRSSDPGGAKFSDLRRWNEHRERLQVQNLPDSFDWSQKGLVGPVRNQKALGSCWAVSTAEAVEGQLAKATGKLTPLSPEQLVECDASSDSSCAGGKGCADCGMFGGWPYLAYQFLQKAGGMFSEADWPYYKEGMFPCMPKGYNKAFCGNHDDLYCRPNSTKGQGPQGLCHATRNEMEMAAQLMQYGPVSVLILADGLQFYHSGVWTGGLLGCKPDPSEGILGLDHAVLADHSILGKSKPYWRLKNSWGTSWGEQGFFRLERGTGRCGVNLAATVARLDSERWAVADWKRFVRNEEDPWRTVQDVITMPAMWNLRNYDSEAGEEHLHTLEQQLDLEDDVPCHKLVSELPMSA